MTEIDKETGTTIEDFVNAAEFFKNIPECKKLIPKVPEIISELWKSKERIVELTLERDTFEHKYYEKCRELHLLQEKMLHNVIVK